MKLFKWFSVEDNTAMPTNVFLSIGKSASTITGTKVYMIRLELPFRIKHFAIDPMMFKPMYGDCRLIMAVKYRHGRKPIFFKVWKLIDPSTATDLEFVQDSEVVK